VLVSSRQAYGLTLTRPPAARHQRASPGGPGLCRHRVRRGLGPSSKPLPSGQTSVSWRPASTRMGARSSPSSLTRAAAGSAPCTPSVPSGPPSSGCSNSARRSSTRPCRPSRRANYRRLQGPLCVRAGVEGTISQECRSLTSASPAIGPGQDSPPAPPHGPGPQSGPPPGLVGRAPTRPHPPARFAAFLASTPSSRPHSLILAQLRIRQQHPLGRGVGHVDLTRPSTQRLAWPLGRLPAKVKVAGTCRMHH